MSSPNDPIRRWKRRQYAVTLVALALLLPVGLWVWQVPAPRAIVPPGLTPPAHTAQPQLETTPPFDPAVFTAALWNPPQPPEAETPPPTQRPQPAPPLTAQLIAIVAEDGDHRAAIFDPTTDQLRVHSVGETIQEHEITQITEAAIELRHGQTVRRLELLLAARSTP